MEKLHLLKTKRVAPVNTQSKLVIKLFSVFSFQNVKFQSGKLKATSLLTSNSSSTISTFSPAILPPRNKMIYLNSCCFLAKEKFLFAFRLKR